VGDFWSRFSSLGLLQGYPLQLEKGLKVVQSSYFWQLVRMKSFAVILRHKMKIQDRMENVRRVSKQWKYAAEDSLRMERKLTWLVRQLAIIGMKIKPTDHHSIIIGCCGLLPMSPFRPDMVKYWGNILSLCPNLKQLEIYDPCHENLTKLVNLLHSHDIKLNLFSYKGISLTEWPFPLENLESLAVGKVSDELVIKFLNEATNLKHLELMKCDNWPTFPAGLLSLKFEEYSHFNDKIAKLLNSPALYTIESLDRIFFDEEFDPQTRIFPKLRHVSVDIRLVEEGCLESCDKLIAFLAAKMPVLESLSLHFDGFDGTIDILFSIPQVVDVLRRLKKLYIYGHNQPTSVNCLNILRSCQNTALFMEDFDYIGNFNHLLSFLVDMSANIKHFSSYLYLRVNVSDLDALQQLQISHEITISFPDGLDDFSELEIQKLVTEEDRQKEVLGIKITAN